MATKVTVEIARADAVMANVAPGRHVVELDVAEWTPEERSALALNSVIYNAKAPTPEALREWAREIIRERAEKEARDAVAKAEEAARAAQRRELIDIWRARTDEEWAPWVEERRTKGYHSAILGDDNERLVLGSYDDMADLYERFMALYSAACERAAAEKRAKEAEHAAAEKAKHDENVRIFMQACTDEQRRRFEAGFMPERELREVVSRTVWDCVTGRPAVTDEEIIAANPHLDDPCDYGDEEFNWHDFDVDDTEVATELTAEEFAHLGVLKKIVPDAPERLTQYCGGDGWIVTVEPRWAESRCNRRNCPLEWSGRVVVFMITVTSPAGIVRTRRVQ